VLPFHVGTVDGEGAFTKDDACPRRRLIPKPTLWCGSPPAVRRPVGSPASSIRAGHFGIRRCGWSGRTLHGRGSVSVTPDACSLTAVTSRHVRPWVTGAVAVAATLALLTVPPPTSLRRTPPPPAGPAERNALGDAWPSARVWRFDAAAAVEPLLPLREGVILAVVTNADDTSALVVYLSDAPQRSRVLMRMEGGTRARAVAVDGERLFWMTRTESSDGTPVVALYGADLSTDGSGRLLVADSGPVRFTGSGFDLQVVADRLVWVTEKDGRSSVHSAPAGGGPVDVRHLDRSVTLTAWPQAVVGGPDHAGELWNLETDTRVPVRVGASDAVACSPAWCRTTTKAHRLGTVFALVRPDGTDRRTSGEPGFTATAVDVALLDRFEVLAAPRASRRLISPERLAVYDARQRRRVSIAEVLRWNARGRYLWWADGDRDHLRWHVLDLHTVA
jgi:hypothetical protein